MELQINLRYLRALLPLAADKDIRYYLKGVCIEFHPDKTIYVAMNGAALGVLVDDAQSNAVDSMKAVIVPGEIVKQVKIGPIDVGHLDHRAQSEHKRDYLLVNTGGGQILGFDAIDGVFPDWKRVIPEKCSGVAGNYDVDLLALFSKVNKALGATKEPGIFTLEQNGKTNAARVRLSEPQFTGVIAPVRV